MPSHLIIVFLEVTFSSSRFHHYFSSTNHPKSRLSSILWFKWIFILQKVESLKCSANKWQSGFRLMDWALCVLSILWHIGKEPVVWEKPGPMRAVLSFSAGCFWKNPNNRPSCRLSPRFSREENNRSATISKNVQCGFFLSILRGPLLALGLREQHFKSLLLCSFSQLIQGFRWEGHPTPTAYTFWSETVIALPTRAGAQYKHKSSLCEEKDKSRLTSSSTHTSRLTLNSH